MAALKEVDAGDASACRLAVASSAGERFGSALRERTRAQACDEGRFNLLDLSIYRKEAGAVASCRQSPDSAA